MHLARRAIAIAAVSLSVACVSWENDLHRSLPRCEAPVPPSEEMRACFDREPVKAYLLEIQEMTLDVWTLPSGVDPDQGVTLRFGLNADGSLACVSRYRGRDGRLVRSVLDAMAKMNPYPPVPEAAACVTQVPITATFANPGKRPARDGVPGDPPDVAESEPASELLLVRSHGSHRVRIERVCGPDQCGTIGFLDHLAGEFPRRVDASTEISELSDSAAAFVTDVVVVPLGQGYAFDLTVENRYLGGPLFTLRVTPTKGAAYTAVEIEPGAGATHQAK